MAKATEVSEVERFRPGSKKSKMYTRYVRQGAAAARKYGQSVHLKPSTQDQWIKTWDREGGKPAPEKKVPPKKATPSKKAAAKKQTPTKKSPPVKKKTLEVSNITELPIAPPLVAPDKVHDCLMANST